MSSLTTGSGGSAFWKSPEGKKFGIASSVVLAGLFGWGLYKALPFLITLAQNTIIFGIECLVIAVMFYVIVLDSSLRNMFVNFYKRLIEALYVLSFNIDPTGAMTVRVKERKEDLAEAKKQAGAVKGQMQAVDDTMNQNQKAIDEGLKKMEFAKKNGNMGQARAESVIVGVAQAANNELATIKAKFERYYEQILGVISSAELSIYVLEGIIAVKTRTYNVAKQGRSAIKKALGVLLGDTDKDHVFDRNVAWIDDYSSVAFGEMDAIMDLSRDALNSVNLQEGVYSQDAFQLLEDKLQASQQKLEGDPRTQKLLQASSDPEAFTRMLSDPREVVSVASAPATTPRSLNRFLDQK